MSGREWSRAHVNGHRKRKIGVLLNRCFSYEGRVTRGVSEKGHMTVPVRTSPDTASGGLDSEFG